MKGTVLIVDNDEAILRALKLMLKADYEVLTANCGSQALAMTKSHRIGCIISDFDMEDGDGLYLLRNLENRTVPFILITGHGEKKLFKEFANERAFYIYEKPVKTDLLPVVREAFKAFEQSERTYKESLIGKNTGHILHDLNNGLAIIESSSRSGLNKPRLDASKLFQISLEACRKIGALVSKYKAFMVTPTDVDLKKIDLCIFLREVTDELQLSLGDEIALRLANSRLKSAHVLADPELLRQVILNLVANSLYEIRNALNPQIALTIVKRKDSVFVHVVDSGAIPHQVAERLFEKGFSTKREKGTGMGLCYSRDLLHKMGASLSLTKRNPTTFTIQFKSA